MPVDRRIHHKKARRTGPSVLDVEAIWPRLDENIRECRTNVSFHWSSPSRNGHVRDALDSLRALEDMKIIMIGRVNAGGHPQDTVVFHGKANIRVKDADEQRLRRWTEFLAHNSIPRPIPFPGSPLHRLLRRLFPLLTLARTCHATVAATKNPEQAARAEAAMDSRHRHRLPTQSPDLEEDLTGTKGYGESNQ